MQISIKNLGVLSNVELELGDITVVCGKNNTGKTYAAYAIYGFLDYWRTKHEFDLGPEYGEAFWNQNEIRIGIAHVRERLQMNIEQAARDFIKKLPEVFASSPEKFLDTQFSASIDVENCDEIVFLPTSIGGQSFLRIEVSENNFIVRIAPDNTEELDCRWLKMVCCLLLCSCIPQQYVPSPFFACADRTGAAILSNELRSLRDEVYQRGKSMQDLYVSYPLAVTHSLNAIRDISFSPTKNALSKSQFTLDSILGGHFGVIESRLHFYPTESPEIPLTLGESSSSVRALLSLTSQNENARMRHLRGLVPGKPEMIMIDEPEMNLHPENQRLLARYFVRLVNQGYKVYITTHSDYIIKELNTLIMLNRQREHELSIMKRYGYEQEELLDPAKVRVYMTQEEQESRDDTPDGNDVTKTKKYTFVKADIDVEQGIYLPSFDDTIDEMNEIQDRILDYVGE